MATRSLDITHERARQQWVLCWHNEFPKEMKPVGAIISSRRTRPASGSLGFELERIETRRQVRDGMDFVHELADFLVEKEQLTLVRPWKQGQELQLHSRSALVA